MRPLIAVMVFASPLVAADPPKAEKASPLVGVWQGKLTVGVTVLRIFFHVTEADGKLAAKLDSPDQGANGIPCDVPTLADGKATIRSKALGFTYAAALSADGKTLKGEWEQAGSKFPFEMTHGFQLPEVKRPQTPKPPFPYAATDVTIDNDAAKLKLAGTLTTPAGDGPFPAVVLVSGSGPQDRDERLFGHKPFLVLADYLSRNGVAVLRYDDRGVGKSTGKHGTATSVDFATDAWAAVEFLAKQPKIDPRRVGIMGHSEGGLIAPMVAADHPDSVAFIVLLAGPGVSGAAILDRQRLDFLKSAGADAATLDGIAKLYARLNPIIAGPGTLDERKKLLTETLDTFRESLTKDERKPLGMSGKDGSKTLVAALTGVWMDAFLRYDPVPTLKKVQCPVLAVNGSLDLQVAADVNLPAIGAALQHGKNPPKKLVELKGLNHLFQPAKTGSVSEYGTIETTFDPDALKLIGEWVAATPPLPTVTK